MILAVAAGFLGVIIGCWLTLVTATAAITRSQAHMQREVRYWQDRTARADAWIRQFTDEDDRARGG